jgi:hypothetical protein
MCCSVVGLDGEWKVAPLRRDMTVLTRWGEEGGVIADAGDVIFVVRRGLVEAILTGQVSDQSKEDIWLRRVTATIKLLTEDTFSEPWCGVMISNCADVDGCLRSRTSLV